MAAALAPASTQHSVSLTVTELASMFSVNSFSNCMHLHSATDNKNFKFYDTLAKQDNSL